MDSSWTLWLVIALVVIVLIAAIALMGRRGAPAADPDGDHGATPETPGGGYAKPRPGLPGEPD